MRVRILLALALGSGILLAGPGDLVNKAKKKAGAAASGAKSAAGTAASKAAAGAKSAQGAAKGGFQAGSAAVGDTVKGAGKGALKVQEQAKSLQPVDAAQTAGKAWVDSAKGTAGAVKATAEGAKKGAAPPAVQGTKK